MSRCRFLYVLIVCFLPLFSSAQAINEYRSAGTGPWTTLATWQRWSGAAWLTPTIAQGTPTSAANLITIQAGHIVNVPNGSSITIDQTTVAGTLQIDNGGAIIIAAVAGTDLTVSTGTVNVLGTITLNNSATFSGTSSSNTFFLSGSRYRHLWVTLGVVPLATWDVNSTMEIAGFTGSVSFTALANWNQAFGNFEVNLTALGNNRDIDANGLLNLAGNLTVTSTGGSTGSFRLNFGQTTSMIVGGALIINGTSNVKFNRNGILSLTVGSFSMASSGTATITELSPGSTTFDVLGNFSFTSGTITKGNNAGAVANVRFTGASPQTYSRTAGTFSQVIGFNVIANAIVDTGTSSFGGTGTFTLSGTLKTGSPTGLNGTLGNSGIKTFNSNCTIEYNGTVAQVMGGLYPGAPAAGINVIINNSFGVTTSSLTTPATLVTSIPGNLNLQLGTFTVGAGHTLQLDGTLSQSSGSVSMNSIGNLIINGSGALGVDPFPFSGDQVFSGFTNNRSGNTVTFADNITLNGAATLTDGILVINGVQLTFNNNVVITGGLISCDSGTTLTIDVAGTTSTINFAPGGNTLGTLNISRSGALVDFGSDITIANDLNITAGTLSAGSTTITMLGSSWSVDGGSGGAFDPGSGLVIFDAATVLPFGTDFNNIQLNATRSLDFPSDLVNVSGNIDFASTSIFTANSGTVGLNGIGDQSINGNATEFYGIQVSKSAGDVNINSALPLLHLLDVQTATTVNTNGHLTIRSRGNTTDLDASIGPLPGGATINGNVRVQRYMHPFGFSANRYISVPVSGATPNNAFADNFQIANGSIRYYNEPTKSYFNQPLTSTLLQGKGYLIWMYNGAATVVWDATGPIYQGSVTLPVSLTIEGWNLVGNPYASAIHWSNDVSAWTRSADISPVVYVSDLLSKEFIVFNYADNSGEGGIIAMGQSFWVKANAASPSLMIHEPAKTSAPDGSFYRTSAASSSEQLIMSIQNDKYKDRSYLKINEKATENFDHLYDGEKLKNEFLNIYFYDKADRSLVMHTLSNIPYDMKIPVVIEATEPGAYQISFSNVENFGPASSLYLIDSWEGKAMAVSAGESYTVQITESSRTISDRFYLSRNPQIPERKMNDLVIAYPNPVKDQLHISIPANRKANVSLIDSQGKTLWVDEMQGARTIDFRNYPNGMFILKVSDGKEVVIRKIVKQ